MAATGHARDRARVPREVLRATIQPFPTFSEIYIAALKALHGQITTARGPGAFGVRAVRADSRASAATSIGIQKGIQPERKVR